jgi:plastocyanin
MIVRSLAMLAATCIAVPACGGAGGTSDYGSPSPTPTGPNPPAGADQINAKPSLAFDPATLTTKVGHVVTFAFGSVGHNVFFDTAAGAPANITGVNANTSVTRTFDTAGTFTYTCHIHPYMQGRVVVE